MIIEDDEFPETEPGEQAASVADDDFGDLGEESPDTLSDDLEELGSGDDAAAAATAPDDEGAHTAQDLEPVYDVPVSVQAVLGKSQIEVSQLLKLGPGSVVELDRKLGEAIDIYVNDRLVARGEVILVDDHLGVTMTEIIKSEAM